MNVTCDYCKNAAKLVDSETVYGTSYGMIWDCRPCDAYVGTHKNSKDHAPLGRLANKELRYWKQRAHSVFDILWKSKNMSRNSAYQLLMEIMGLSAKEAHIGKFDIEQCQKLILGIRNYHASGEK